MIFGQKKHHLILVVSFRKYVRSRHALLKALTRPFLGVVLTPKYWAIRRIASFVLKEVIYVYLLTSFRKYWAILDLNQKYIFSCKYPMLYSVFYYILCIIQHYLA